MSKLRIFLILAVPIGLILAAGRALGGLEGLILSLTLTAAAIFASYWFCDRLVLSLCGARRASAREEETLLEVVNELATRAGLPVPRIYLVQSQIPNAFATGRNPRRAAVAASSSLLQILDRDELAGVMAHELAHIKHRDGFSGFFGALLGGAAAVLANMAHRGMLLGARQGAEDKSIRATCGSLLSMRLAPIATSLTQVAVSRSREYSADAEGAKICGNPLWLARALRKLDRHNRCLTTPFAVTPPVSSPLRSGRPVEPYSLARRLSRHPPLEQRIRRLEASAFGIHW